MGLIFGFSVSESFQNSGMCNVAHVNGFKRCWSQCSGVRAGAGVSAVVLGLESVQWC